MIDDTARIMTSICVIFTGTHRAVCALEAVGASVRHQMLACAHLTATLERTVRTLIQFAVVAIQRRVVVALTRFEYFTVSAREFYATICRKRPTYERTIPAQDCVCAGISWA